MSGENSRHVKDMAITWADLVRLLPNALPGWSYRIEEPRVEVGDAGRGASIVARPLPARAFGPIQLARLEVEIELRGLSAAEAETFMRLFDRAYQRGGG